MIWRSCKKKFRSVLEENAAPTHLPIHYYQKPYIYEPQENQYRLDVDFLRLRVRRTVCLIGFWESEGYFKDIEDCIRREYMLKVPPDDRNAELLAQISQSNAVSLHIRRGDKAAQSPWGALPMDYYVSATDYVAARSSPPLFYVFSDDGMGDRKFSSASSCYNCGA